MYNPPQAFFSPSVHTVQSNRGMGLPAMIVHNFGRFSLSEVPNFRALTIWYVQTSRLVTVKIVRIAQERHFEYTNLDRETKVSHTNRPVQKPAEMQKERI